MMPPEFVHHEFDAIYSQEDLGKMRLLISHGANPVHPSLRKLLVERPEPKIEDDDNGDHCLGWTKRYHRRLMPNEVFQELKLLGFDINSSHFELIDTSDI